MAETNYHLASNDARLDEAWYLKRFNVFHAWKYTTGQADGVVLAIADTGISMHEDLPRPDVGPTVLGDTDFDNAGYHGTGCWSTVKTTRNNGVGTAGVAPDAHAAFLALGATYEPLTQWAQSIDFAITYGVKILSISWGPYLSYPGGAVQNQIISLGSDDPAWVTHKAKADQFVNEHGGILCLAGGNASLNQPIDVLSLFSELNKKGTLNVSAICPNDIHTTADYGADIDIISAYSNMLLPHKDGSPGYAYYDGMTSWGTPMVAGVCALVWSINPTLTNFQVIDIVKSTASPSRINPSINSHWPNAGILNAGKAVKKALATVSANSGQVFPYLGFDGTGAVTTVDPSSSSATTVLSGTFYLDLTAFSSDTVSHVELWQDTTLIYSGSPALLKFTGVTNTGSRGALTVKGFTAGASAEETYSDILVDAGLPKPIIYRANTTTYHAATNDGLLDQQWQLKRINAFHAWKYTKGSDAVRLMVFDEGVETVSPGYVDPVHPDLPKPKCAWSLRDHPDGAATDATVLPYSDYNTRGTWSHGTTVYANIMAKDDNALGVVGVAPGIWCGFVSNQSNAGADITVAAFVNAVNKCTAFGVRIITSSAPFDWYSNPTVKAALDAYVAAGGLLFGAVDDGAATSTSGYWNTTNDDPGFAIPAADTGWLCTYPGAVAVGAIAGLEYDSYDDPRKDTPGYLDYGPGINLVAPGADTFTCGVTSNGMPMPSYNWWGGETAPSTSHHASTSFGTPIAAAVAALVLSIKPTLTNTEVKQILYSTADMGRHADYAGRYPNAGIVNAGKAVKKTLSTVAANAGKVFPYIGFSGKDAKVMVTNGGATTTLNGSEVYLDIDAFSSDPITSVELWIGKTRVYRGAPNRIKLRCTYGAGTPQLVSVVGKTATTTVEEVYTDILVDEARVDIAAFPNGGTVTSGQQVELQQGAFQEVLSYTNYGNTTSTGSRAVGAGSSVTLSVAIPSACTLRSLVYKVGTSAVLGKLKIELFNGATLVASTAELTQQYTQVGTVQTTPVDPVALDAGTYTIKITVTSSTSYLAYFNTLANITAYLVTTTSSMVFTPDSTIAIDGIVYTLDGTDPEVV